MSLKDRLNKDKQTISENSLKYETGNITNQEEKNFYIEQLKKYLEKNINILVCCPIEIPTYNAINYLCSKIPNDKRLVGIGANLLLNPDEIIKFEPETNNNQKQLIQTALNLNPYKIILQNFDGTEAVDIFKLINAGIKNIIGAVTAESAIKALSQAELNLYINGVSVPESIMKKMVSELFDIIIVVENNNGFFSISEIDEVKPFENDEYNILKISESTQDVIIKSSKIKTEEKKKSHEDVKTYKKQKNKLLAKLKKKNSK